MPSKNRTVRSFFLGVYIFVVFIYVLTCLIPFLDPGKFWFVALLGMGFPFLLGSVIFCAIIAALKRSRWFFLSSAALLLSFQQIGAFFSFHFKNEFEPVPAENSLRVLSWNVSSWTENNFANNTADRTGLRNLMMDAVQMQNADVICFQEYFESFAPELYPSNIAVFTKMGYNYYYFTPTGGMYGGKIQSGLCIFSKFPIKDSLFHKTGHGNSEGMSMAAVEFNGKLIRIFNTHLESPRLKKQEYSPFEEPTESRTVLGKIKRAYALRSVQADTLRQFINASNVPAIVCGDFNDVPNSYSYFKIKGNLQDAFLKKGSGIGRTFQFISPTLRIDFLLADKRFKVDQFAKLDYKYSDHYPQVMDVSFK
jgi:endonuclease/exonuclease/phosphatase family metal-dependent hydrolase